MCNDEQELTGAVEKLRIDAEPRPEHRDALRRRMLAAFQETQPSAAGPARAGRARGTWRSLMHIRLMQASAAAIAAACLVAAIVLWPGGKAGVALAEVRRSVEQARTACFQLSWYRDGQAEASGPAKWREPGLLRWEVPGAVTIYHWNEGKFLTLMTEAKTAHAATIEEMENPYHRDWIRNLKESIGSDSAEEVGHKEIAGREARGWRFKDDDGTCTVWADAETGQLLRADFESGNSRMVMTEFVLNQPLDEDTFSLTPPAGYSITRAEFRRSEPSEKDLVLLLRVWAMGNGDVFPDKLDPAAFSAAAAKVNWSRLGIRSQQEGQEASNAISRAFWLMYTLHERTYVGGGVKLGDAAKPILWHRPKGKQTYRVIYGDLSVKDVAPEDLPKKSAAGTGEADGAEPGPGGG